MCTQFIEMSQVVESDDPDDFWYNVVSLTTPDVTLQLRHIGCWHTTLPHNTFFIPVPK